MFENALVESTARIRTKVRYWMIATFFFNIAVAVTVSLVPLLFPQALPKAVLTSHFQLPNVPRPRAPKTAPQPQRAATTNTHTVAPLDAQVAPSRIPDNIRQIKDAPPAGNFAITNPAMTGGGFGDPNGVIASLGNAPAPRPTVQIEQPRRPQRISGGVMQGQLLVKTQPVYPQIARAAHVSGTVVLHAIIAKDGTIQDLRVISGNEMLRNAALDAVRTWRYRPYLLSGEATEVDTTITVNFNLDS